MTVQWRKMLNDNNVLFEAQVSSKDSVILEQQAKLTASEGKLNDL